MVLRRGGPQAVTSVQPQDKGGVVAVEPKPTVETLAIDLEKLAWRPAEAGGEGAFEIAFAEALDQRWVLMRVVGDPDELVTVYTPYEWECFLDGAKAGEFGDPV